MTCPSNNAPCTNSACRRHGCQGGGALRTTGALRAQLDFVVINPLPRHKVTVDYGPKHTIPSLAGRIAE